MHKCYIQALPQCSPKAVFQPPLKHKKTKTQKNLTKKRILWWYDEFKHNAGARKHQFLLNQVETHLAISVPKQTRNQQSNSVSLLFFKATSRCNSRRGQRHHQSYLHLHHVYILHKNMTYVRVFVQCLLLTALPSKVKQHFIFSPPVEQATLTPGVFWNCQLI